MALLVIIGTVAVFAVVIFAILESKRVDKGKGSLLDIDKNSDQAQD